MRWSGLSVCVLVSAVYIPASSLPAVAQAMCSSAPGVNCTLDAGNYTNNVTNTFVLGDTPVQYILRSGADISPVGGDTALALTSNDAVDVTLVTEAGSTVVTTGNDQAGIWTRTGGAIDVTLGGNVTISTTELIFSNSPSAAVLFESDDNANNLTVRQVQGSVLTSTGMESVGLQAQKNGGSGLVSVQVDGRIIVSGQLAFGAYGWARLGGGAPPATDVSVIVGKTGHVTVTSGDWAAGALALNQSEGAATINHYGLIEIDGQYSDGVNAGTIGATSATASVTLHTGSSIRVTGDYNVGAKAITDGSGDVIVTSYGEVSGSGYATLGLLANAHDLATINDASATVSMAAGARVTTDGAYGHGVVAYGPVDTMAGNVSIANGAEVTAAGREAAGVTILSNDKAQAEIDGRISAQGELGAAAVVRSELGDAQIDVGTNAVLLGGWQTDVAGRGSRAGGMVLLADNTFEAHLKAAGVILSANGASVLNNSGSISALSDRAILIDDCLFAACGPGSAQVNNASALTGFIETGVVAPTGFDNLSGARFTSRHFADTNGDGVRDTKRVAVSTFGGAGSMFSNASGAVVDLGAVAGAGTVDATGYYVPTTGIGSSPLDTSVYDFNRDGLLQAQFMGLERLEHAGTIDLRGSVIGNSLVVSSAATAAAGPGSSVYVANGGTLLLNTHFNAGVPAGGTGGSVSDVLVLDQTLLGSGATRVVIDRRTGAGDLTPGNGILLVEVRDKAASVARVFALAGDYAVAGEQRVVRGVYSYALHHNGVAGDAADGNWYLRNAGIGPTVPVIENTPPIVHHLVTPPTFDQRVGARFHTAAKAAAPVQPMAVFCKDPSQNFRCTLTADQASYYVSDGDRVVDDRGVWARIYGGYGRYSPEVTTYGQPYSVHEFGLQAGVDHLLHDTGTGRVIGGLNARIATVKGVSEAGSTTANGGGLGATLSYVGDDGLYVDAQANGLLYSADLNSSAVGAVQNGLTGWAYALSLETGKRLEIEEGWAATPQVQLTYSNVGFDPFMDLWGANVSLDKADSLKLRVGLSVDREVDWADAAGEVHTLKGYGIANIEHEFLDGSHLTASGIALASRPERTWASIGAGGNYSWDGGKTSVFGEVLLGSPFTNFGSSYEASGNLGLKVRF
jgi:outer membrane autotransporter protein